MTPNLFGNRFAGVRKPGWHALGKVYADAPNILNAVLDNNLNYCIHLKPLLTDVSDGRLDMFEPLAIDDRCAIMREPTTDDPAWKFLGVASTGYSLIQNIDIARIIEPLTDIWPMETIGALGNGETLFITLKAGTSIIRGEAVDQYFLITDTRNGGTSFRMAATGVRVVCQNTLITALRQATATVALQHTSEIINDVKLRVDMIRKMQRSMDDTVESFKRLAKIDVSDKEADDIFDFTYPIPNRPVNAMLLDDYTAEEAPEVLGDLFATASSAVESFEYYCNRTKNYRDAVRGLYGNINAEYPAIAGTAWAAYNAVVEFADFREGKSDKSVAVSSLFGSRATEKKRAFQAAIAIGQ